MNDTRQPRPQSGLELPDAFETSASGAGGGLLDRTGTEYVRQQRASNGGEP